MPETSCPHCDTPVEPGTHDCCPAAELDHARAALLNISTLTSPDHVYAAGGFVDVALVHALAKRGLNGTDPEPELPLYCIHDFGALGNVCVRCGTTHKEVLEAAR